MKRAFASFVATLGLLAYPALAQDEGAVSQRRVGVSWEGGVPRLHFSAADFADRHAREALEGGLQHTLVMRLYAFGADGQPIAVEARSCRVVYHIWERYYRVEVRSRQGDVTEIHASLPAVLDRCLVVDHVPIGTPHDWAGRTGSVYFGALLELDPLSPDEIQRLRRWLAQPAAGGRVGGEAFLGSFVSLFVNQRIGSADRTLRFRSQTVAVPR